MNKEIKFKDSTNFVFLPNDDVCCRVIKNNPQFGGIFTPKTGTFYIKKVIYNNPAIIILWNDNTKTVAKCLKPDLFDIEKGLAIATLKKIVGTAAVRELFRDWVVCNVKSRTLSDVRKDHNSKEQK